jgi:oligo-1,6-glucosidase
LAINENYNYINVAEQESNPNSVLHFFRKMVHLRKSNLVLIYGKFELVDNDNKQLFAYTRSLNKEQLLVVLNFSDTTAILNTSIPFDHKNILISNYENPNINNTFQPYAAVIYKILN